MGGDPDSLAIALLREPAQHVNLADERSGNTFSARGGPEAELFDRATASTEAREMALQACARCPALAACRAWVEGLHRSHRRDGVVGGLVIRTRRTARSAARGRAAVKADGGEALKT